MEDETLYTCTTLDRTVPLDEFRWDLVDVPRFSGYCQDCPNYGRFWSCPPFWFDPMTLWQRYDALRLYARKLVFTKDRLFPGERRAFEATELPKIKGDLARARLEGKPCRMPERMRWSIEALGGDCGGALEKYFGESLQWSTGQRLPEQIILLGGLLLKNE